MPLSFTALHRCKHAAELLAAIDAVTPSKRSQFTRRHFTFD
jgi:hypothetical protein